MHGKSFQLVNDHLGGCLLMIIVVATFQRKLKEGPMYNYTCGLFNVCYLGYQPKQVYITSMIGHDLSNFGFYNRNNEDQLIFYVLDLPIAFHHHYCSAA